MTQSVETSAEHGHRVVWLRKLVEEGLASGIIDDEPEHVIEKIVQEDYD